MKIFILSVLVSISLPSFARDCGNPSEALQTFSIKSAVANTEKLPVRAVDITAPGLAIVEYGTKGKQVIVTYGYSCNSNDDPESIRKSPDGFHVISYVPRVK
jgi:hypothetical protein